MGRPKKVGSPAFTVTAAPPGSDIGDGELPDAQASDTLSQLEDEGKRRAEARIFRLDPTVRKMALLDTVDASQADEGYVRETYGGGQYSVQFWGPRTDGSWGYLKKESKTFVIDSSVPFKGSPRDRAINPPPQNGSSAAPAGSTIVDLAMVQLLNGFQEQAKSSALMARDHSAAMMAMMERLASPRDSGMEKVLTGLVPIVAPLIAGMLNRKDPVEIATTLMAAMKPVGEVKSGLSSLHELIELKEALALFGNNGDGDGEAGWMRLLEKVVPGAIEILKNESAKTGQPITTLARRPAAQQLPATTARVTDASGASTSPLPASASSAGPASSTSPPEGQPVSDEWTALEGHMSQLANMAASGKHPYDVMKMVKVLAPERLLAGVRELVQRDDALDFLLARFPVLAPYRGWTDELLDYFYADFFPDEIEDEEPPADGVPPAADESGGE